MRLVALLRGINVGGNRKVPMERLRTIAEELGYAHVRTVLASGNLALDTEETPGLVRARLADALAGEFGYDAQVLVLSQAAVRDIAAAFPFPSLPDVHDYILFFGDADVCAQAAKEGAELGAAELGGGPEPSLPCLYWQADKGQSLSTDQAALFAKPRIALHSTNRNVRTLHKIAAL